MIVSRNDLTDEQLVDIEDMIDEGMRPAEIAREMPGVPVRLIQNLKRDIRRASTAAAPVLPTVTPTALPGAAVDPLLQQMNQTLSQNMQMELMRAQIDGLAADRQHRAEMNKLEREEREMALRERKLQMREDYGTDDPEDDAGPQPTGHKYDVVNDPLGAFMSFMHDLRTAPPRSPASGPANAANGMPVIDVTKPLTKEQIHEQLKRFTPEQIAEAQKAPESFVIHGIRQHWPGITEENIKAVMHEIRHYGSETQKS